VTMTSDLHDFQTENFISVDPVQMVFHRQVLEADGAGGKRVASHSDLLQQRVRVIGQTQVRTLVTPDGRQVTLDKVVIGTRGMDVQAGDEWEWKGDTYEVVHVQRDPGWRVLAESTKRGAV